MLMVYMRTIRVPPYNRKKRNILQAKSSTWINYLNLL